MAAIKDLLRQITDPALCKRLSDEFDRLSKNKKFGLVFEEHIPECTPLYGVPIKRGSTVARKTGKMNEIYTVKEIDGETAVCIDKITKTIEPLSLVELVSVAQFGEPIFPSLEPIAKVKNAPNDALWHTLIEADNYHALQLLEYLYEGQVDCIYIDPPYNTGARDWKYNNDYVDSSDVWRHNTAMERLETFADKLFSELYDEHQSAFRRLKEERRDTYKKLAMSSATPVAIDWDLPQTIDFSVGSDAQVHENHIFIPTENGEFKVSMNDWESGLIKEELSKGAIAWLRNLDRKKWSLEVPYEVGGVTTSMFPDLLVIRAGAHGYVFDVLEPHDPSRKDNYPKAIGLAKFAEKHGERFGRIQLIRKVKGADRREHFYRLDMGKLSIRNKVRGVTSNAELDRIFDEDAMTEE